MKKNVEINYEIVVEINCKGQPRLEKINVSVSPELAKHIKEERKREERDRKRHSKNCMPFDINSNTYHFSNYDKPHRNSRFYTELSIPDFTDTLFDDKPSKEEEALLKKKQLLSLIYAVIRELPHKQRKRINLHFFDGLSIKEIAKLEGVQPSAITQSIKAALRTIVNKL